jgi:hypothetical protein
MKAKGAEVYEPAVPAEIRVIIRFASYWTIPHTMIEGLAVGTLDNNSLNCFCKLLNVTVTFRVTLDYNSVRKTMLQNT